jgi:hypothetical protein
MLAAIGQTEIYKEGTGNQSGMQHLLMDGNFPVEPADSSRLPAGEIALFPPTPLHP